MKRVLELWIRLSAGLGSRWRNLKYRLLGVEIDGYVWLRPIAIPRQWADVRIGRNVALDEGVVLLCSGEPATGKITLMENVYINRNSYIDASVKVEIGAETMIGPNCYITDHDHDYATGDAPGNGGLVSAATRIGRRVWLGAGVTVLKGVTIGDDALVGAGSVVTKDVPERAVAVGVPAKIFKERPWPEGGQQPAHPQGAANSSKNGIP